MRPLLLLPLLAACAGTPRDASAPCWIAHRGNSSAAPENTLAAVRSALALDPPPCFVEIDVHRTADGELAVIHDATLDRTTDATGEVAALPWSAVASADAGYADEFGDAFRGERVPSLEAVLDAVAGSGTGVMIEVKAHGAGGPAAALARRRGETLRHVVASFHADVLVDASLADPGLRTLFLVGEPGPEHVELARRIGASILGVGHESASAELVATARAAGLEVWAWTVNDPTRAAELASIGVGGVISDRVGELRGAGEAGATIAPGD